MRTVCKKHGPATGFLVSPELSEKVSRGLPIAADDYVKIDYEYDADLSYTKDIAYTFYLSRECATRNGFSKSERLPLSDYDNHPGKTANTKPVCFECLQESLKKGLI